MLIERHSNIDVLRDDTLPGGTKSTFLHLLLDLKKHYFVYASPVYGGFQIALAAYCKSIGKQAVIFCPKRKTPFINSLKAKEAGAVVYQVPYGYLSNCQSKARDFAAAHNAQLLNFGADYPAAINSIAERMQAVTAWLKKEPDEIFCAAGSGTLLKGIIQGTANAVIYAVQVGADLKLSLQGIDRVKILKYHKPFEAESKAKAPFPSCTNYDLKAWEYCLQYKKTGSTFFWNVL
jgi:hypothetical protein